MLKGSPERQAARTARKAELAAMFAREKELAQEREAQYAAERAAEQVERRDPRAAVLRRRANLVRRYGYQHNDGTGYGVYFNPGGTITVGDPELDGSVTGPLAGARATLETPADARTRVTVARSAALSVFALVVLRSDKRLVLVITTSTFEAVNIVDSREAEHLRKWVAWFNTKALAAAGPQDAVPDGH
jgi:hypothetical protein